MLFQSISLRRDVPKANKVMRDTQLERCQIWAYHSPDNHIFVAESLAIIYDFTILVHIMTIDKNLLACSYIDSFIFLFFPVFPPACPSPIALSLS